MYSLKINHWGILLLLALFSLLAACANIVSPQGGNKDLMPPKVVKCIPEDSSINFSSRKIIIVFDEYIQTIASTQDIIFNPQPNLQPGIQSKAKSIEITFNGNLEDNTTYTVHFGKTITDYNEGNTLNDYTYCFSTGNHLDTLRYQALLLNAFTLEPIKNTILFLYNNYMDSTILKNNPKYKAKSNEKGEVAINNLTAKPLYAIALTDENNNLRLDDGEKISTMKTIMGSLTNIYQDTFLLFDYNQPKLQSLLSCKSPERGIYVLSFDSNASAVRIKPRERINNKLFEYEIRRDDAKQIIYYTDAYLFADSAFFVLSDSGGFNKEIACENAKNKSLSLSTNVIQANYIPGDSLFIQTSTPILSVNSTKIKLLEDSIIVSDLKITQLVNKIYLANSFKPGSNYILLCDTTAVLDFRMQPSSPYQYSFNAASEESTSSIGFAVYGSFNNQVIVQLLNASTGMVYRQQIIDKQSNITFGYIVPGPYKLRVIDDINENSVWDNGDYFKKIKPEKVFVHPEIFSVKQNLEIDKVELKLPF